MFQQIWILLTGAFVLFTKINGMRLSSGKLFQNLFPDDYDKRTAPPKLSEGKSL